MEGTYKKNKGSAGIEGVQFQLDLLVVFLLNALRNRKGWRISTENQGAGKYDDLVLDLPDQTVFLQSKFKQNKRITKDQLFSSNSRNVDFSLPKYFFSYLEIKSSKKQTVILCTNTKIIDKDLGAVLTSHNIDPDCLLYYEGASHPFFTFNEKVLPELRASAEEYLEKNLRGKNIDKAVITEGNMKAFLNNFQFFSEYPCQNALHKIIEEVLSRLNHSVLCCRTSYYEIYRKVEEWFKQPRGRYFTEVLASTLLNEIHSDRYCEFLKGCNVSFCENFDFTMPSTKIFHVKTDKSYLLQVLKIFYTLHNNNLGQLWVDPNQDLQMHKQLIEEFRQKRYTFMVLIWSINSESVMKEIGEKLKGILDTNPEKKLILVAESNTKLAQHIGLKNIIQIDGSIRFKDLSEVCRENLLNNKRIIFRDMAISLRELLTTKTEEYKNNLDSEFLEKLIIEKNIKVRTLPLDLDEDITHYYRHRTFEKIIRKDDAHISKINKQPLSEDSIYNLDEKMVLISDGAGMGKSTVLTKLAVAVNKANPNLWVIRINLNEYTSILRDSLRKKQKKIDVIKLLNSQEATRMSNLFEELVFSMTKRVVLMLDGVDEISPDYTDLILNLLTDCYKQPNFAKLFVTTRPHLTQKIEEFLKVRSFKMQPFTKEDQIDFLTSYWTYKLHLIDDTNRGRCKLYAEILIDKLSSWIKTYGWESHFTAVPLQVRMLAEIFQENSQADESEEWEGCKQYISGNKLDSKLPEKFNIISLYDMFIDKKRDLFIDKGSPSGNTTANQALDIQFKIFLTYHRKLALEIILKTESKFFSNDNLQFLETQSLESGALKMGIVQKYDEEFQFMHRTFAEYFVAQSVLSELKLDNPKVEFLRILIDKVLLKPEFAVVRAFLDILLRKVVDDLHSDIFKNYRSFIYENNANIWIQEDNPIFVLSSEGCAALLKLVLKNVNCETGREIDMSCSQVEVNDKRGNTLLALEGVMRKSGINFGNKNGETALHHAVANNNLEVIKVLIEHGADPGVANVMGYTAFLFAADGRKLNIVRYFIEECGIDVDFRNKDGRTALHVATAVCGMNVITYLEEKGADVTIKNNNGFTTLHEAAWNGRPYLVKHFLKPGIDVNVKDYGGCTPMHLVAGKGMLEAIEYLVEAGANVNDTDNMGCTALHLTASDNYLDTIKRLVDLDIDVNAKDSGGRTALHYAALRDQLKTVEYLVDLGKHRHLHGVNVNVKDNGGRTALHYASEEGRLETVQKLVELHVDVNVTDIVGRTALHLATQRDHLDVIQHLLEHNIEVNVKDLGGRTTLHFAVEVGKLDTVKYLVRHGGNADVEDVDGRTPLHLASELSRLDIVEFLVKHIRNVNIRDDGSQSALHSVAKGISSEFRYLVKQGADIKTKDLEQCHTDRF